jgi:hypothetical protein
LIACVCVASPDAGIGKLFYDLDLLEFKRYFCGGEWPRWNLRPGSVAKTHEKYAFAHAVEDFCNEYGDRITYYKNSRN